MAVTTLPAPTLADPPGRTIDLSAPASAKLGDKISKGLATGAGAIILVVLAGVGLFLLVQGAPALQAGSEDLPNNADNFWTLAGPLAFGSIWSALLALVIATPVAIGVALFIAVYAPRKLAGVLGALVDLLAAVPSVVYGLWGLMIFAPLMSGPYAWLNEHLGWIPFFAGTPSASGRTILTAGIVLAIMILPIMASICREVFVQTPALSTEAALALGATRWEMIRLAVLPFGRSGVVSGAMLGLGRALGETMAIAMVLSPTPFLVTFRLLESTNPNTVSALIAQTFPEAEGLEVSALIGLGLVLFVLTFAVNALARKIAAGKVHS
jgi:phosphate transport system permease protein